MDNIVYDKNSKQFTSYELLKNFQQTAGSERNLVIMNNPDDIGKERETVIQPMNVEIPKQLNCLYSNKYKTRRIHFFFHIQKSSERSTGNE